MDLHWHCPSWHTTTSVVLSSSCKNDDADRRRLWHSVAVTQESPSFLAVPACAENNFCFTQNSFCEFHYRNFYYFIVRFRKSEKNSKVFFCVCTYMAKFYLLLRTRQKANVVCANKLLEVGGTCANASKASAVANHQWTLRVFSASSAQKFTCNVIHVIITYFVA